MAWISLNTEMFNSTTGIVKRDTVIKCYSNSVQIMGLNPTEGSFHPAHCVRGIVGWNLTPPEYSLNCLYNLVSLDQLNKYMEE